MSKIRKQILTLLSTAILSGSALPALADANALLQSYVEKTRTLQAKFTQSVFDRNGRLTQESKGDFALSRPGKFRWTYAEPYNQLIVGDGKKVWIHDADLEQVTVRKFDTAMGATPAALLAGSNNINKHFRLKDGGAMAGLEWVEASPINEEGSFTLVRMGFKDDNLMAMDLSDNFGQTTHLTFSAIRRNPNLSSDLFRFKPPKGADIIGAD